MFALADGLLGLWSAARCWVSASPLALMAGFKAIVLWFPPERVALANGWLVMLGALGAVTATAPAELVVQAHRLARPVRRAGRVVGAGGAAGSVRRARAGAPAARPRAPRRSASLWAIYRDRRFWRIAPLSAIGIGTSWSLQGLWAAPWLRDVDGLDRAAVVQHLSVMAVAVCASALLLGIVADRLRRSGIKTELVLASTLMRVHGGSGGIGVAMAGAVISCVGGHRGGRRRHRSELRDPWRSTSRRRCPGAPTRPSTCSMWARRSSCSRATGLIIAQWPEARGTYPAEAHQAAMATTLILQLAALAWFAMPQRLPVPAMARAAGRSLLSAGARPAILATRYTTAAAAWTQHLDLARRQATSWRLAAVASAMLCLGLAAALSMTISQPAVAVHIIEANWSGRTLPTTRARLFALFDEPAGVAEGSAMANVEPSHQH